MLILPLSRCSYVYGALGSHILGYVGAPNDIDKEEASKFTFYQEYVEGKSNIEKAADEYLRGKPGVRYLRRNAKGTIDGILREDPPQQGANVFLTIDARIQAITEEALLIRWARRCRRRRSKHRRNPRNGVVTIVRSKYVCPQHQGKRLDGASEG